MSARLCALILVLPPRKAPVSLVELCRFPDVIVLGKVERVATVHREPQLSEREGLLVWARVRGLFECADCADHRAADQPWLDSRP
jgi:hypothetical protein